LGNTGYDVSAVVYGGIVSMDDGQDASDRYVEWAVGRGINYFDVAPTYGDAEEKLGRSLRPYRRDVYLACKTTERRADAALRELERSMDLLGTDYFDNYQLHALSSLADVHAALGPGGIVGAIAPLREQGVLRKLGITCHSEAAAVLAIESFDFDTVLFPLNWHMNLGFGFGDRVVAAAKAKGMGVLGMKQLIERAWLSEDEHDRSDSPKSWCKPIDADDVAFRLAAIKYTLSLGADTLVPPGNFRDLAFVVDHIDECLANPLTEADRELLTERYARVKGHAFFDAAAA
jgi:hypothetical protein